MSPALLRRYRAERLLRREFEVARQQVLAGVHRRLSARGVTLGFADLEECYAAAWQGLYTALLRGESVENPVGWLTVVCYRRAIDEHRTRLREQQLLGEALLPALAAHTSHVESDLAGQIDDRTRLRHTFEALRERLDARERQAASLCYLQGLTRAQAAAQMGIGEARMRKLMEGRGPSRPGVAAKVEDLLRTIRSDGWCEQQASLMRALAFGLLDPNGERHQLAELHRRECPACRAYVLSLRGLAAVLPPLILPAGPLAAVLGGAAGGAGSGATGIGGGAAGGAGSGAAGIGSAAGGTGSGAASIGSAASGAGSGAAGIGSAAGGSAAASWLPLGGSLTAKLAASCLVLAGLGGGCLALIANTVHTPHAARRHTLAVGASLSAPHPPVAALLTGSFAGLSHWSARSGASSMRSATPSRGHASRGGSLAAGTAQRELSFERTPATVHRSDAPLHQLTRTLSPSSSAPEGARTAGQSRGVTAEFGVR